MNTRDCIIIYPLRGDTADSKTVENAAEGIQQKRNHSAACVDINGSVQ